MSTTTREANHTLINGRTSLHLRQLDEGSGTPLLLLHDLFGSMGDWQSHPLEEAVGEAWDGPVWALDFAGHGDSAWRPGGAYYPELFATDANAALEEIGSACVAGIGLGAYVALLIAGARAEKVPGSLLLPGTGMEGGGQEPAVTPNPESLQKLARAHGGTETASDTATDPRVILAENDIRPVDYACSFGTRSAGLVLAEDGHPRPGWWESLRALPTSREVRIESADARDQTDFASAFTALGTLG